MKEVKANGGFCKGKISTRYVICVLGSIGLGIAYGLKVNFHVAIVSMVKSHEGGDAQEEGPFDWENYIQGILLSSYFWGYMIAELPAGRLAEAFSAKWVMFFAIAINVVCACLSPLMAEAHWTGLLIMRILQGIGGGTTFPGMHVMLAHWAPPGERSVMSTIVYSGTALGTVIFMLTAGLIAAQIGWEYVFYIHGGVSAIWLIFWLIFAADTPAKQAFINQEERDFIMKSLHQDTAKHESKVPWKAVFTSMPFLAILIAHTCSNWGWYMVLVELPLYMKTVLKFKLKDNAFLTALPFLTMWIFSMIFSKTMDTLRDKNIISTTTARKIATGVASIVPLLCFVFLNFIDDQKASVALMTLAITGVGGMFCGFLSNHIDISPNFAGTLVAITNTVATIPGIVVPITVSELTEKDPSKGSWRIVFWITIALYAVEFIIFTIFGSGEEQPWNEIQDEPSESQPLKSQPTSAKT